MVVVEQRVLLRLELDEPPDFDLAVGQILRELRESDDRVGGSIAKLIQL
jgi:hypothetical protein